MLINITSVNALPARGTNPADYFGGDLSHVQPEQFTISPSVNRTALDTPYYDYPLIQHFNRSTFKSGHSGYDADIIGGGAAGSNMVTVNDATPFTVGQAVVISPYTAQSENNVVTGINAGTGVLTLQNNLTFTHPATGIHSVSAGARTHTSVYQTEVSVEGSRTGGDFIAQSLRIAANPTHNAGRDHAFDRTTIGFLGGDAFALTDGVYIAGTEFHYYDKGNGPAARAFVIDQTRSFIRENDTPGFGCVWLGSLYKSEGSKACNSTHVISGKWKRGIDTALADFGTDQAAGALKTGHRIYWGCLSTPDLDGFAFWADTLGGIFIRGDNDGTDFWEVNVGGSAALRVRSTGVAVGGSLTTSGNIITGGDVEISKPQGQLTVPMNGSIRLNGMAGDTYLTYNGTSVMLVKSGTVVASW